VLSLIISMPMFITELDARAVSSLPPIIRLSPRCAALITPLQCFEEGSVTPDTPSLAATYVVDISFAAAIDAHASSSMPWLSPP